MGAICDESASDSEFAELDTYLRTDQLSCDRYMEYCWVHVALTMELQIKRAVQNVHRQINNGPAISAASDFDISNTNTTSPPIPTILYTTHDGSFGHFFSGGLMAYLLAAIIVGIGLVIMAVVPVSQPMKVATQLPTAIQRQQPLAPKEEIVGRITGMVDCNWDNPNVAPAQNAQVPLGQKYALASGLMEITYDTGAKVILQGPVTYKVDSAAGGYLAVGKLTARLEKKVEAQNLPSPAGTDLKGWSGERGRG